MTIVKSKIKKSDQVIVIAGKDKGKIGQVVKVVKLKQGRFKVLVEGINMVKKHVKPNPQANEPGGIKEIEALLESSNVSIYNSSTKKADKIGYKILDDGKKVRIFKSTGEVVDIA